MQGWCVLAYLQTFLAPTPSLCPCLCYDTLVYFQQGGSEHERWFWHLLWLGMSVQGLFSIFCDVQCLLPCSRNAFIIIEGSLSLVEDGSDGSHGMGVGFPIKRVFILIKVVDGSVHKKCSHYVYLVLHEHIQPVRSGLWQRMHQMHAANIVVSL